MNKPLVADLDFGKEEESFDALKPPDICVYLLYGQNAKMVLEDLCIISWSKFPIYKKAFLCIFLKGEWMWLFGFFC
jgi:hypothetical protein